MNKYKILGVILHIVYRILSFMTRKEYFFADGVEMNNPNIIVFWHRKIFTVCNATRIIKKKASIVSASKDGEILAELLKREGNQLIRGSSNRDNIKSLKEAMKYAKENYTLGIAIDGPSGPIFEPKSGAIFIAKKTGMPIVPVSSYCSKKWIFKIWGGVALLSIFLTFLGYVLAESLSLPIVGFLQLFGAGALIAMVSETLIPEAFHESPKYSGTLVAIGFVLLLFVNIKISMH